jgi:hypothetical protein
MHPRPSIAERLSDLMGLVTEGLELFVAHRTEDLAKTDPELAAKLRGRLGPGFTLRPEFDEKFVAGRFDFIDQAHQESVRAFGDAVQASKTMIRVLGNARDRRAGVAIDGWTIASHQRAIHSQVLLFHLRAAQVLCAMQEIEGSIRVLHESEPDPCAALPPKDEEAYGEGEEEAAGEDGATRRRGRVSARKTAE